MVEYNCSVAKKIKTIKELLSLIPQSVFSCKNDCFAVVSLNGM